MSETLRYYDNPYSSTKETKKYQLYYYAYTKKLLNVEDCITYSEDINFRNKSKKYKENRKSRANLIKDDKPIYHECNDLDNSYNQEGIIDKDKWYVYYKDKVYSKERYKYLNIHKTKKYGNYCILNSGEYNNYKYKLLSSQQSLII